MYCSNIKVSKSHLLKYSVLNNIKNSTKYFTKNIKHKKPNKAKKYFNKRISVFENAYTDFPKAPRIVTENPSK